MSRKVNIGIIGDHNASLASHPATDASIGHAASSLHIEVNFKWVPTRALLTPSGLEKLEPFDAIWMSSGSPYRSMEGALNGTKFAREKDRPYFAT